MCPASGARWDAPSGPGSRVTIDPAESVFRLLLVFALAFGIGLERQIRRKPVGFGTFIFVSTGAAALAIRANDRVFGFTTAALVWAMAALGVAAGAGLYLIVFVNYGVVWAVVITDRFLEGRGFGSHAKIVHLTIANPVSAEDLDVILPPSFSKFERVHVDKEAHQVSVTAQVRLKPTAVAGLLEALRRNDKVRKFEIE